MYYINFLAFCVCLVSSDCVAMMRVKTLVVGTGEIVGSAVRMRRFSPLTTYTMSLQNQQRRGFTSASGNTDTQQPDDEYGGIPLLTGEETLEYMMEVTNKHCVSTLTNHDRSLGMKAASVWNLGLPLARKHSTIRQNRGLMDAVYDITYDWQKSHPQLPKKEQRAHQNITTLGEKIISILFGK